ncbi:hypothetical protein S7711_10961 [Stachybotrys chartarum IBT 7711]|uniref:Uncharacterized protein n=1 Tax=Stachybotrys chartarum (strain CBS 109288 / IBT 7711) TaxID=1280523 RepID=A0A084AS10_STACB|nr:hypothetical protein S7711_10961 [Stachybotrys chartarum IBT 7711]KFA53476.1 hypothetical protein S40293_10703 [Stachybotrys chartarum IBT 40293]KFA76144.1 hypothetical protein S40288_10473 [Stachybotrys chartarum IBT 40288]
MPEQNSYPQSGKDGEKALPTVGSQQSGDYGKTPLERFQTANAKDRPWVAPTVIAASVTLPVKSDQPQEDGKSRKAVDDDVLSTMAYQGSAPGGE